MLFAAALVITGCSNNSTESQGEKGLSKEATAPLKKKVRKVQSLEERATELQSFCSKVVDKKAIGELLDVNFEPTNWRTVTKTFQLDNVRRGRAVCDYHEDGYTKLGKNKPAARAKLKRVLIFYDCRNRRRSLEKWKRRAKMWESNPGSVGSKEVVTRPSKVGSGGSYLGCGNKPCEKKAVLGHQLFFNHSTEPCTIHITLSRTFDDKTEILAAHLDAKLNSSNRPSEQK